MDSCGWCMIYSMPCLRSIKSGSVGAFMQPLRLMVRYWGSYIFWTVMCMSPPTQWFNDPPWYFSIFQLFYNKRCSHEECIFKGCIHWKCLLLEFYPIFCLCSLILLNNIFHDLICLVNIYSIFTFNNANVEEI